MAKHLFSQRFFFRCVKFVLALLLLPVLIGLINAFWRFLSAHGQFSLSEIWFISGFFIFPVIYYLQVLPGHIYVFGHEITHAMWVIFLKEDKNQCFFIFRKRAYNKKQFSYFSGSLFLSVLYFLDNSYFLFAGIDF